MPLTSSKKEIEEVKKAQDYAYKLLTYRPRSSKEIAERLKRKGFSHKITQETIEHLAKLNYLNDKEFAQFWIRTKIQSGPIGRKLLQYQLRQKGITGQIIEAALQNDFAEYDENQAARKVAVARMRSYRNLKTVQLKRRLYNYLYRRGFCQEAILQALQNNID